jgi:hypothetical protein
MRRRERRIIPSARSDVHARDLLFVRVTGRLFVTRQVTKLLRMTH